MKRKTKILIGIMIVLLLVQFIQPTRNLGNAFGRNDFTHSVQVPGTIMRILKTSCFDCHSNHTNYPWYTEINPVGWWLNHHVDEGKRELNFSEFGTYSLKKKDKTLKEIAELVQNHQMPLSSYTWIHKDAILSDPQTKALAQWTEKAREEIRLTPQ